MKKLLVAVIGIGVLVGCSPEGVENMNTEVKEVSIQEPTVGDYTEMVVSTSQDLEESIIEFNTIVGDKGRHFTDDWYADLEYALAKMRLSITSVKDYEGVPSEMSSVHEEYVNAVNEYSFVANNFMNFVHDKDIKGMRKSVQKMKNGEEHMNKAIVELQKMK